MQPEDRGVADNDIAALRENLGLAELNYVDLSARRELEQVLQRWPLLAELAALRDEVPA